MSYQTFVANSQLSSSQMNTLQQSVYTRPKSVVSAATYTLLPADAGKIIEFTNVGSISVTVPNSSSYDFTIGTTFYLLNVGAGTVTVSGASGVTTNSEGGLLTLATQWSSAELVKISTNGWVLSSTSSKVQTAELDDLSVTTAKLANSSVTSGKLATGAVGSTQIADGSITPAKLADVALDTKIANYELVLADKNKIIEMNVATVNTVTVPLNTTQAFPNGTQISIVQYGLGKTQIIGPVGLTIIATPGAYLRARYSSATLVKRDTNEWYLFGDLSAS